MPQHDLILDNASGAAFRADANSALAALGSTMKGPNAPPAPIAGMMWLDDDTPSASVWTWKVYDGADWLSVGFIDISANTFTPASLPAVLLAGAGSQAAPAHSFAGDPDTGIYLAAPNEIAVSVGGLLAAIFKSSGNVGFGTLVPDARVHGAAENPPRGIIGMLSNQSVASQNGAQLTFLQLGVNWWTIGQPAATDAFSIWRGRHPGGDGTEVFNIDSAGNLKFNSGYGSAALAFGVRAWVNFNGIGTVAIRGSGGVTSITDNGVGDYTVNFNFTMPSTNYAATVSGGSAGTAPTTNAAIAWPAVYLTTSLRVGVSDNNTDTNVDVENMNVIVVR